MRPVPIWKSTEAAPTPISVGPAVVPSPFRPWHDEQFWSKIGVTQSGGSRYESGRNMPKPVRELLRLVHVEQVDIQRIKRDEIEVIEYLKSEEPELFKTLKKSAKSKVRKAA